jgi:hypothetical protein
MRLTLSRPFLQHLRLRAAIGDRAAIESLAHEHLFWQLPPLCAPSSSLCSGDGLAFLSTLSSRAASPQWGDRIERRAASFAVNTSAVSRRHTLWGAPLLRCTSSPFRSPFPLCSRAIPIPQSTLTTSRW